ncbi:uncharacterized protein LOC114533453 [Dendronephthya gigantea]|uniref:uncharacterized protein LOC114533453 n=1 Tax=Dendronephthya gigantea TaxID=151771 RepID=UPI00106CAA82|nr:uncharacterized protein LOC114533453 [Dendronephthya gigantea]
MKMLCFLAGELTNSATYFSTFADVNQESMSVNGKGTFGRNKNDTWKPWKYSERIKQAKKVSDFKKQLERKNVKAATKRTNVLPETPFYKFVNVLRSKCNLNRLAKRIIRWYDENAKLDGMTFNYRFTGKDSRMFLHNFMFLIDVLENGVSGITSNILHVHAYLCLCLRNAVALFSRVNITDEQVRELKKHCENFHRGYWLYLKVNPTVWTLGLVVPVHTKEMKERYGLGLGLNSMEGREAKHIAISKYCANTAYSHRWQQVFHHEYISLIWLRKHGYNNVNSSRSNSTLSYFPKRVRDSDTNYCDCGLQKVFSDELCRFCGNELRNKIKESLEKFKNNFDENVL